MNSRTFIGWLVAAAMGLGAPAYAAPEDPASARDLQRLQQDIENLDEELFALEDSDPAAARRLQRRADEIRDDTVYLRNRLRRYQDQGRAGIGVTVEEVDELRQQVRALRADIDRAAGTDTRRAGD